MKTLAKPVANRIKVEVRRHPKFSELCTNIGQLTHQVTSRLNVMASGYKILRVEPLPEDEALARGINFVSESFIFGVGGGILVFEYQRSEAKTAAKALQAEEDNRRYQEYLDDKFQNLYREIKSISGRLDDIETRLEEQEKQRGRWLLGMGSRIKDSQSIDRKDSRPHNILTATMPPSPAILGSRSDHVTSDGNIVDSRSSSVVEGSDPSHETLDSHSPPAAFIGDGELENDKPNSSTTSNTEPIAQPTNHGYGYWALNLWKLWYGNT